MLPLKQLGCPSSRNATTKMAKGLCSATTPLVRAPQRLLAGREACKLNSLQGRSGTSRWGFLAPHRSVLAMASSAAVQDSSPSSSGARNPPKLSGAEIRERFLSFFESKGHARLPSSSLVPEDPTVLLTIAGMLQFKPIFMGETPRKVPCATTTQKCVRTNDIENVGVTARHHTFFEMLGNFSFGDYFKKEAIQYAWQLSTEVFELPPERIWVSVYEEDEEAYQLWLEGVGVPAERIKRMDGSSNFWASGATGPCGPCSELYYDFAPERGVGADVDLEDDSRFIEFYNLVFMELQRTSEGKLLPLENKNIDTGLGLERVAQILQGVPNNYETDLILHIVDKAASLAGVNYATADNATKTSLKVIGDHTRAVTYLISDGVTPSNIGRGYVVRRLLRRVVMKGRLLGIKGIFTPTVAEVAIALSGPCDPNVAANAARIYDVLKTEEATFSATLERGQKQLNDMLAKLAGSKKDGAAPVLAGTDAFLLYDSFGFPLELTQEMAEQQGVQVDVPGFEKEMAAQRARSKDSREEIDLMSRGMLSSMASILGSTQFLGYESLQATGEVKALLVDGQQAQEARPGSHAEVVLDSTPFYAESGGQAGDQGLLCGVGASSSPATNGDGASTSGASSEPLLLVSDVQKAAGGQLFVHMAEVQQGVLRVGDKVTANVDPDLRRKVRSHHTATHLLQSALKRVLGPDTCQQGSQLDAEHLRFDFNLPRPMKPAEVAEVERLVNSWVQQASPAVTKVMDLTEAKAAGATAMFGEKYDDVVRVVDVPGISMELCGGTHVSNTSEIGAFKVVSESGIASGIRRIEAVAGAAAVEYMNKMDAVVRSLTSSLNVKPEEVASKVSGLQSDLKAANKEIEALRTQLTLAKSEGLVSKAVDSPKGAKVLVEELEGVDAKAMQEAAQKLLAAMGDPAAVVLATRGAGGKQANFVAAFSPKVVEMGLQAGKVVGSVAKACGGGGGGKPQLAQAGAKDPSKVQEALELARKTLMEGL
ncbi:tRNA synthetases class II (A)-domain-containing protein [Dunaliella salina]|uniref:Alanine--tRNA ligase n=1 Tax=Dunaliella salina TaxID=3046 RepID=A0ABQ7H3D6_DUNSA|nr:tRNA synthetases class II (A)-domain-containing protein [Dunaliella salina]|eukprot:KAF5841375.1 tRNA synthetases class II (A)-domain-containing protein [Dunaliella salina]